MSHLDLQKQAESGLKSRTLNLPSHFHVPEFCQSQTFAQVRILQTRKPRAPEGQGLARSILSWPLIQTATSSPVSFPTSVLWGPLRPGPLTIDIAATPTTLSPVPEPLVSTSPASRPQPTLLVPPGSQSVSSLCTQDTDEGHLCLGVETPGRRAGSHLFYYPHCPGSPLLGLSSPSWPSWPWDTVCTAQTKQRSNINF